MARIHPAGWREVEALGAAQREIETLHLLAEALPDAYSVFHGVHWTRLERGASVFGDIDFVIVAPSGRTLLIEQKAGFLTETPEGLMKAHGRTAKNVAVLLARNADAVRVRFAATHQGEALPLETLLYCPDHHVRNPAAVGIEPERIVHAGSREPLSKVIRRALPLDEPASPLAARVGRFFADVLELVPDIGAVTDKVDGLYTRLSGGLAEWGRRIEADPFRLHVIGTAGSGKTQLALAAFRDAVAAGRRPLYVCYNRPLADHMAGQVPPGGEVATYHQLCERTARMLGQRPDFSRPDAFRQLEAIFADSVPGPDALFDELLVDEGQDFDIAWRDPLLRRLREGGRAWWFEDPMQNLYSRPPVPLPGWVRLRADTNFRSPTQVVALLGQLLGDVTTIHGASPVEGEVVTHNVYSTQAQLIEQTKSAITHAVGQGFKRSAIVVLTYRGREQSALASMTHLGSHPLRAFTGRYDLFGNPDYSDGETVLESVYRFKGQSAPCVILTEIDFEAWDERSLRKLFVGATRATLKLVLILSERADRLLREHPTNPGLTNTIPRTLP